MATVAGGRFSRLKGFGGLLLKRAFEKSKHAANKSVELIKGTTLRDVYDKGKVFFMIKPSMSGARSRLLKFSTAHGGPAVGGVAQDNLWAEGIDAPVPQCYIVVARRLPLRAEANPNAAHGFQFSIDNSVLPLQFFRNLPVHVIFVGTLPLAAAGIPPSEELANDLLEQFSCRPVFLGVGLQEEFDTFNQQNPPQLVLGGGINPQNINMENYEAFVTATDEYADCVLELVDPDGDRIFILDNHLWALPAKLHSQLPSVRIFFRFPHEE